jgi:hypothetical protein
VEDGQGNHHDALLTTGITMLRLDLSDAAWSHARTCRRALCLPSSSRHITTHIHTNKCQASSSITPQGKQRKATSFGKRRAHTPALAGRS